MRREPAAPRSRFRAGGRVLASGANRGLSIARAVLTELFPPAAERCGRSRAVVARRGLLALIRHLRGRERHTAVALDTDAAIAVDLSTRHGRQLFACGFCEPAAWAMRSLLKPGDVVIDGGANIGIYTILAAAAVGPKGRVIACEPSPGTIAMLRENVRLNDFRWVDVQECALAAEPGRRQFHAFTPGSGYSSFAPADQGSGTQVEVAVTTLDDLAEPLLARIALVKLDTEGAELLALQGARRLLGEARPDFIVELEPEHLERQGASVEEVQTLFTEAGYAGLAIVDRRLEPLRGEWNRPTGDPNIVVRPRERVQL
jgi:FkbM family methyltransferase